MKTSKKISTQKYILSFMGFWVILLFFNACKKEITETEVSSSSILYLKGSNNDKVTNVKATKDGGFIFCGNTLAGLSNTQGFLLKVDGNGKQQWYRNYENTKLNTLEDVIECSDGSFIAVGGTIYDEGFNLEYVLKTDAFGKKEWEKSFTYGSYSICNLKSVIQGKDNKIYATGFYPSSRTFQAPWILCFDLDGNEIYSKQIEGLPSYKPNYFNDNINLLNSGYGINLAINSSNDLLISTQFDIIITNDNSRIFCPGLISLTKDNFKINYYYPYENKPTPNGLGTAKIIPVSDGNLYFYNADVKVGISNYPQIIMIKTDLNGVPLWTKSYKGLNSAILSDVFFESENSLIIIGTTSSFPTNNAFKELFFVSNSMLLKVDNNGNELFSEYAKNSENVDVYKSIRKIINNEYLVAGYTSLNATSYHKMFIKKLNDKAQLKF